MKLFHVRLPDNVSLGYDSYDSFVVACENEDDARNTHPSNGEFGGGIGDWIVQDSVEILIVKELGKAGKGIFPGVICASYNAG
jgi:hypothetical protein